MELNGKNFKKILLLVFLSTVIIGAVIKIEQTAHYAGKVFSFFSPIIAALCIAFVLNVLLRGLENKVFFFMDKVKYKFIRKLKRPVCLVLTYILAFGIISLLVLVIIPDLIDTTIFVVKALPSFLDDVRDTVVDIAAGFGISESKIPNINIDFNSTVKSLQAILTNYSNKIVGGAANITTSILGGVYDTFFSVVISVYILAQKERIGAFVKRFTNAYMPKNTTSRFYHVFDLASELFSRFIGGQLIEAVILGALCYVGMLIFQFPNPAIISVLIGVSSLVPIVGPIAGVVVGAFLIVITSPIKALLFIVFMLILQQIEGNVIYPKVVGKAVGLPSVVVVSAVVVGGNIGGIFGVLLSVPISALIFTLIKEGIQNRKNKLVQSEQ